MKFCRMWLSIIMAVIMFIIMINMNTTIVSAIENEEVNFIDDGENKESVQPTEVDDTEGDAFISDDTSNNKVTNESDNAPEELNNESDSTLVPEDIDQGKSDFDGSEASQTIDDVIEEVTEVKEESRASEYYGLSNEETTSAEDLMQMDIVATDGNTYHLSDFNDECDYITVLFGSRDSNTQDMLGRAATIRDSGVSMKIVLMGLDFMKDGQTQSELERYASKYGIVVSCNFDYNSAISSTVHSKTMNADCTGYYPHSYVLNSQGNLLYHQDYNDLASYTSFFGLDPKSFDTYDEEALDNSFRNMAISATDGNTYRVSDFEEDYVAIVFCGANFSGEKKIIETVSGIRYEGRSIKLVLLNVNTASEGTIKGLADTNQALLSFDEQVNGNMLFNKVRVYKNGPYAPDYVKLPTTCVLDSDRHVVYCFGGEDVEDLTSVLKNAKTDDRTFRIKKQPRSVNADVGEITVFTVSAIGAKSYQWYCSSDKGTTWQIFSPADVIGSDSSSIRIPVTSDRMGKLFKCTLTGEDNSTIDTTAVTIERRKDNLSAAEELNDLDVVDLDGNTYHVSDFTEDYITVVFGGGNTTDTEDLIRRAAQIRDSGKSMKIILMGLRNNSVSEDQVLPHLQRIASNYNVLVSNNYQYNGTEMSSIHDKVKTSECSNYLPQSYVLNSERKLVYHDHSCNLDSFTNLFGLNSSDFDIVDRESLDRDLRNFSVSATDGKTYKIGNDFTEDYIAIFFVAGGGGSQEDAVKAAAEVRDKGHSIKIITLDINRDTSEIDGLNILANNYSTLLSVDFNSNSAFLWSQLMADIYGRQYIPNGIATPTTFILDSNRHVVYYGQFISRNKNIEEIKEVLEKSRSVGTGPEIIAQPKDVTVAEGKSAKFSVNATGTDLTYLWQYKNAGSEKWVDWTSKRTAAISVAYNAKRNGMSVRCVVTDGNGISKTSNAAVLTYAGIEILTQPKDTTVAEGKAAKFSVSAKGTDLSYLWQYKNAGSDKWVNWTSKKTAAISVAYNASRNGMGVRCVITDGNGISKTSDAAVLTYAIIDILTQPQDTTVAEGKSAKFSVSAKGTDLAYLWQYKNAGSDKWVNWTSKKTAAISVAYNANRNGMSVRCVITDGNGNSKTSDSAILTYAGIEILTQPQDTTVAEGKSAKFSVSAKGTGLTYLWQYKKAGSNKWVDWTSKTTASISIAYQESRNGMSVRCVITDSNGNTKTSDTAVMAYAAIEILTQPKNTTVASGKAAKFSVSATGTDLIYLWQYKKAGSNKWVDWTSKTTASISIAYQESRNGMSLRCLITDSYGNQKTSETSTLTYK